MDVGALIASHFSGARSSGTLSISSERIDANSKSLTRDERVTLSAVATLQGETADKLYGRFGLTKHSTESNGVAFTGGVQVHNVNDFLRALESSAEMHGGTDRYGVKAEEYGRLVDIYA